VRQQLTAAAGGLVIVVVIVASAFGLGSVIHLRRRVRSEPPRKNMKNKKNQQRNRG